MEILENRERCHTAARQLPLRLECITFRPFFFTNTHISVCAPKVQFYSSMKLGLDIIFKDFSSLRLLFWGSKVELGRSGGSFSR